MKQRQMRLDNNLYRALKKLKDRDGIPLAESVRRAVRQYLDKQRIEIENSNEGPQDKTESNS